MTVIVGFFIGLSVGLVLVFGWWQLRKLILSRISLRQTQPGLVTQSQYSSDRGRRDKELTIFKLLIVASSFLVVGVVASFLLLPYPTYLVVSWVVLIIIFSNILNQELRSYFHIDFEQVLTTLHLTAMKVAHLKLPLIPERDPLRDITDTTAYLNVLRQTFKPGRKKKGDSTR